MIGAIAILAAAATQDCGASRNALEHDKCALAQSMAISPPPDCKEPVTQTDMNICSYRDYLRADIALNEAWQELARKASGDTKNRHLDAQRKWLAYRDAQCLAENGPRSESGTIWPLLQNTCLTSLTEARTKQLRDHVEIER
ncbi:lysozyme inhibitor LprI family protein [Tsuneonella suprasediminis]|uniref:lysozyme inhibitor LprI family protein n=1 Tax=Tsuneonella suprasediminis TaxID=2306996 RepID=UPI002F95A183